MNGCGYAWCAWNTSSVLGTRIGRVAGDRSKRRVMRRPICRWKMASGSSSTSPAAIRGWLADTNGPRRITTSGRACSTMCMNECHGRNSRSVASVNGPAAVMNRSGDPARRSAPYCCSRSSARALAGCGSAGGMSSSSATKRFPLPLRPLTPTIMPGNRPTMLALASSRHA